MDDCPALAVTRRSVVFSDDWEPPRRWAWYLTDSFTEMQRAKLAFWGTLKAAARRITLWEAGQINISAILQLDYIGENLLDLIFPSERRVAKELRRQ